MRSYPKIGLLFLIAISLVFVLAMTGLRGQSQKDRASDKNGDATPVQSGVMSEKQRQHSKLFKRYKTGRKLDTAFEGAYVEPPIEVFDPNAPILSFNDFLKQKSCESDAVIIAEIKDRSSQLTENNEFIFTDYTATVTEVLKDNSAASIPPGSSITLTRPGGKVNINGRIVNALDSSFQPFEISSTYLLILKYVPTTGAYETVRKGSFLLRGGELTKLTEESVPGSNSKTQPLTNDSRTAIQNCSH